MKVPNVLTRGEIRLVLMNCQRIRTFICYIFPSYKIYELGFGILAGSRGGVNDRELVDSCPKRSSVSSFCAVFDQCAPMVASSPGNR